MQLVPVIFAAVVAGLWSAPYLSLAAVLCWPLSATLLLAAYLLRQRTVFALALLFFACSLLANLLYPLQLKSNAIVDRAELSSAKLAISGIVVFVGQRADERSNLDLRVNALKTADEDWPITEPFLLRLFLDQQPEGVLPGDRVTFAGRVRKPRLFGTPGEFNWPRSLASQGVQATAWLKDVAQLQVEPGVDYSVGRSLAVWKNHARGVINASLATEQAELVRALVLGEGRSLSDKTRRILAASGISHLFAISGLHLGLLALFGYRLLLVVYRRFDRLLLWQPPQRVLPLLLLPALLTYLLLTGDAVATRRAFCLAFVAALLLLWRRQVQPLRLLFSLALIFLLINPLLLWQPSWQLSFAGAAGIVLWRPVWQDLLRPLPAYLRMPLGLLLVTVAATLATLPLVMLNFHLLAPVGPLANLLCVPLVAMLALPCGLVGLLMLPSLPFLAEYCFLCCGYVLEFSLAVAAWLTGLPGLAGQYHFLTLQESLALFIYVLPLLLIWQLKGNMKKILLACSALFTALSLWGLQPSAQAITLNMLSVGQGESMLLNNRHQQAILVDGGGLFSDRFDVGERLLAPALGRLGVKKLTAVVLTHDHPDHRKGLHFILENFTVEQFWSGAPLLDLHPELQQLIVEKGIRFHRVAAGWTVTDLWVDNEILLFRAEDPTFDKNDGSLVLYLQDMENGLLLTGDLEQAGVGALLAAGFPGPVSMLKLPHHGSRNSGTERLLDFLMPQSCLVSAGYRNRYRLPAKELLAQLETRKIKLLRTDLQGTIRVESTLQGWQLSD